MICSKCGCNRVITVKASVNAGGLTVSLKRLCLVCLLSVCNCSIIEVTGDSRKIMLETEEQKG